MSGPSSPDEPDVPGAPTPEVPEPAPEPQPEKEPPPEPTPPPEEPVPEPPKPERPEPELPPKPEEPEPPRPAPPEIPERHDPGPSQAPIEIPQQEPPSPGGSTPIIAASEAAIAATDAPTAPLADAATAPLADAATAPLTDAATAPLAEAPRAKSEPRIKTEPPVPRAPSRPRARRTDDDLRPPRLDDGSPDAPDDADDFDQDSDEYDEDTAARRLGRRFMRATTDIIELGEELRGQYRRHDGVVIALALVIVFAAAQLHRHLVTPEPVTEKQFGLTFARSTAWLAPEPAPMPAPRLVPGVTPARPREGQLPYHVVYTSALDAEARLEVLIDERPPWSNLLTGLELDRRTRYGELYAADSSQVRSVEGHDWLRTEYHYAFVPEVGDQPRIGHAVEYATVDREHLYVITFHGSTSQTDRMEDVTAPSLRVESRTGMPLLPQVGRLDRTKRPAAVDAVFPSTAMVVVVDVVDGRLRAAGGASGIVIGADGSILTNYHVIRAEPPGTPDPQNAPPHLHDLFVIGRFAGVDKPPQLVCAGRPSRAKYDAKTDLALLKCDTDLDGRAWSPSSIAWPAISTKRPPDVRPLERLWVLGYPDVGGGGLTLSQGIVEGWTGAEGAVGRDYLKTDAPITHGNSGGPVVDNDGRLIGIATAYRTRVTIDGSIVETAKVGLVRPLAAAENAIETVRVGWTPREGHNSFELEPQAIEAPPEGVYLSTRILDAANDQPLTGALLMVLRPQVGAADIDMNKLDEQVLAWGRANADGEVHLKQPVPVPGTYSVLVVARGYEPLIGDHELHLAEDTAPYFDPWGVVRLQSR
jgi:S1-C subfamily serine protease